MSIQITDKCKHRNRKYDILMPFSDRLFDPKQYGFTPYPRCTACHRGYWCEFVIADDILMLDKLFIYTANEEYPPINGILVSPETYWEANTVGKHPKKVRIPDYFGHRMYQGLQLVIPFSGRMVLGANKMPSSQIRSVLHPEEAYRKLIEISFDEGMLVDAVEINQRIQKD